jgi:hypothetical protein
VGCLRVGMRHADSPPPDAAVAEVAAGQWGVVSLSQLVAAGLDRSGVARRVRGGRLHRVSREVYAVGHVRLCREGRWMAAVLACGEGAVLSHRSAASHWGLLANQAALIDVTGTRSRTGASGVRLHRSRFLDARDTTKHQGIPITTVPRTLLDLAATVQPHRLERALAQAQRLQLYDHRAIADLIARSNGHRGIGALTKATSREDPKWTRSELEAWFLTLVRDAGLPEPLVNESLTAPDHPLLEVDFYWPTHRLIVELDGTWHEPRDTIHRRLQALLHH